MDRCSPKAYPKTSEQWCECSELSSFSRWLCRDTDCMWSPGGRKSLPRCPGGCLGFAVSVLFLVVCAHPDTHPSRLPALCQACSLWVYRGVWHKLRRLHAASVRTSAQQQSQLLVHAARKVNPELYEMVCAARLAQLTWKRITSVTLGCSCNKFNPWWPVCNVALIRMLLLICKASQIVNEFMKPGGGTLYGWLKHLSQHWFKPTSLTDIGRRRGGFETQQWPCCRLWGFWGGNGHSAGGMAPQGCL